MFCVAASDHIHILWLNCSQVLFDSTRSSEMFKLEVLRRNTQCVYSHSLSVSLSVWQLCVCKGGGVCAPAILCRLNYNFIDVVSSSCIGCLCVSLFTQIVRFSLSRFCWFPCFVIFFFYKYCCMQANRSTYDIIMEKIYTLSLCQRDFYISPSLCADILVSFGVIIIFSIYCCCRIVANLA